MSSRICHVCISYLNSWQSFKNRCIAAQKKQSNYLEVLLAKDRAKLQQNKSDGFAETAMKQQRRSLLDTPQRVLKNALTQLHHSSPYANNNSSIDVVSFCLFFFLIDLILLCQRSELQYLYF